MYLCEISKSETKQILKDLLKDENLTDFEFEIAGNSENGDGFVGDVVFVHLKTTQKDYNLVLKCSKASKALRENFPVQAFFLNETAFYTRVFPTLLAFQAERNIAEPFANIPKCYGALATDSFEIIAMENVKVAGYVLAEKTRPLTRPHIDIILKSYGKLHATSVAMESLEPERFQKLKGGLVGIMEPLLRATDMITTIESSVAEVCDLFKKDLHEKDLQKWQDLKREARPVFEEVLRGMYGLKVISHGDCWNNNFMYYYENDKLLKSVILDWQLSSYNSPIMDLSYFLFSCLSEEDLHDLDAVLETYYRSFSTHLENFGCDSDLLYPKEKFLGEWRRHCKYGLMMAIVINKVVLNDKDEVPDLAASAEKGENIMENFCKSAKNIDAYKERIGYIVHYVAQNNFI